MVNSKVLVAIGVIAVIFIILIALIFTYYSGYNTALAKDENVKKLAADTDTQLQRRYDLIPDLVQSVKGYMQFERQTLDEITRLRTQWMSTPSNDVSQKTQLGNMIENALGRIILTYESYPSLKSDKVVTRLMDELAGTENRISVARTYYNDGVRDYNTYLRTFPTALFNDNGFLGLKPWGFNEHAQFQANTVAKTNVPQVNLTLS